MISSQRRNQIADHVEDALDLLFDDYLKPALDTTYPGNDGGDKEDERLYAFRRVGITLIMEGLTVLCACDHDILEGDGPPLTYEIASKCFNLFQKSVNKKRKKLGLPALKFEF